MVGFAAVAGMALTLLATVVLLPAFSRLRDARAERAALQRRVESYDRLIDYKQRLAESIATDPMQTERLLMQQQNFRRPEQMGLTIDDAPIDRPIDEMLAEAAVSAPPADLIARTARIVQRPATRRGLLLVAALMMIGAMVLFLPPAAKTADQAGHAHGE